MHRPLIAALAFTAAACQAQDFPARAINLIVPNPPGGMNQIHAQPLSVILEKISGQPAPVVNRPGAVAAAGTAYVVNQPADGHHILVTTPNLYLAIEKDKLYGVKSPYSLDQIELLALLSADPLIMTVHPQLPVKNTREFIALAKARPGELVYSSSGAYGILHTPVEMFAQASGLRRSIISSGRRRPRQASAARSRRRFIGRPAVAGRPRKGRCRRPSRR